MSEGWRTNEVSKRWDRSDNRDSQTTKTVSTWMQERTAPLPSSRG